MADAWATIQLEREALAADLESVDEEAWTTASLCPQWTIRDVVAHMTALARMTPPRFFLKLVRSRFNPARLQARDITIEKGNSVEETLARFRKATADRALIRAVPGKVLMGETLVHAEDIRRPLGLEHHYPTDALMMVAELYTRSNMVAGSKRRIAGLSLQATDASWSTGSGPSVSGPMLSLVMAMAGRQTAVEELQGDGVQALRART